MMQDANQLRSDGSTPRTACRVQDFESKSMVVNSRNVQKMKCFPSPSIFDDLHDARRYGKADEFRARLISHMALN
jgi:hypothetical protein